MTDAEYALTEKLIRLSDAGAILHRIDPGEDLDKERLEKVKDELRELQSEVYEKIVKEKK